MNCLRTKPGIRRKSGAILAKCARHSSRPIVSGRPYRTMAVIMAMSPQSIAAFGAVRERGSSFRSEVHQAAMPGSPPRDREAVVWRVRQLGGGKPPTGWSGVFRHRPGKQGRLAGGGPSAVSSVANPPSSSNATGLRRSRRLWCRPPVLTSDRRVFSSGGASVRRLDVSAPPGPSQYEGPPRDGCLLNPEHTRGSVHRPDPCAAFCRCSSWLISLGTDWCRWLQGCEFESYP